MRRIHVGFVAWLVLCAVAAGALRDVRDPSLFHDRIALDVAETTALASLRAVNAGRYADYLVVSSAWSEPGELGEEGRWVVLCDASNRRGLSEAVVVEVGGASGEVIRMRRGVGP